MGQKYTRSDEVKSSVDLALVHVQQTRRAVESSVAELKTEIASLRLVLTEHSKRYDQLQTSIVKTLTFLFQLLDDPDAKAHAKAVVHDYKFNQGSNDIYGTSDSST